MSKECLQQLAPELIELRNEEYLREKIPYSVKEFGIRCILFSMIPVFSFVVPITLLVAVEGKGIDAVEVGAMLLLAFAPIGLLYGFVGTISLPLASPQVTVWKGKLISRLGWGLSVVPVAECRWRRSFPSHMSDFKYSFILPGEVLMVSFDESTGSRSEEKHVAVGYTPEARKTWESFFRLIDLPKIKDDQSKWSRTSK